MDSISNDASSDMERVVGTPSIIYNGSLLFSVPSPRIRIVAFALGAPSVMTDIPATFPWAAFIALPYEPVFN